ncbi:MAG: TolC family protein [Bacteroidales bacterium]|jgi:NodT family efflux transporter outer membrane factor (OMF) lipoprotein|nr:TolC family protein [Bacteroidales bacterium]
MFMYQNTKSKIKLLILNSSLLILVSGCGIYTKYSRPEEIRTDNIFGENVETTDTTTIGNLQWTEVYSDSYLQELIQKGLENNTDLQIARLRINQAQASLKSAKLAYTPSVSVNPSGTISSFDGQSSSKTYELPVSASWEIDIFGKLTNQKRQSEATLEESEAYKQAVQSQLIANIANYYYTLLMLDEQLRVSQQTAENWKGNVKTLHALKKAGETNEAAVSQAEANKCSVDASVLNLKLQITEIQNSLCALLGDVPQTIERGSFKNQTFPQELSVGIPVQLLSNRPDVKYAEASLKKAFYYTNEARSYFYPSLNLSGMLGWTNSGGGIVTNPGALIWQAVGSLTQPIFNQGTNKARFEIAKSQQEEAKLTFQQTILDAGAEVNTNLAKYQTAKEKVALYEKQIQLLESAVKSTQLLMQHGTINYLEVLTAQQTLLDAELSQISNRFDEIQSVINLYSALGGGSN